MKKRYMFTLTESNVVRLQALLKQGKLPPATMSFAIDTFVEGMVRELEEALKRGRFTASDYVHSIGRQLELIENIERSELNDPNRKTSPGRPKAAKRGN